MAHYTELGAEVRYTLLGLSVKVQYTESNQSTEKQQIDSCKSEQILIQNRITKSIHQYSIIFVKDSTSNKNKGDYMEMYKNSEEGFLIQENLLSLDLYLQPRQITQESGINRKVIFGGF